MLGVFGEDGFNELAVGLVFFIERCGGGWFGFVAGGHFIDEGFEGCQLAGRQVADVLRLGIEAFELALGEPSAADVLLVQADDERRHRVSQDAGFQNVVDDVDARALLFQTGNEKFKCKNTEC